MRFKKLHDLLNIKKEESQDTGDELVVNPYYTEGSGLAQYVPKKLLNEPGLEEVYPEDSLSGVGFIRGGIKSQIKPTLKNSMKVENLSGVKDFFKDFVSRKKIEKELERIEKKAQPTFFDMVRMLKEKK